LWLTGLSNICLSHLVFSPLIYFLAEVPSLNFLPLNF
jgi:hypothetical protein